LEIITRKNHGDEGDMAPFNADVHDEVLRRNAKVGYTTKYGECPRATKIMTTVPCGKTKLNIWPRDENGQLIGD